MKFKKGDRVRCILDRSSWIPSYPPIGSLGFVVGIVEHEVIVHFDYQDDMGEGALNWYFSETDLELVEETRSESDQSINADPPKPIKKLLFVEDGSVDVDTLTSVLEDHNPDIYVVVYRQGSRPPFLTDIKEG